MEKCGASFRETDNKVRFLKGSIFMSEKSQILKIPLILLTKLYYISYSINNL